LNELVGKIPGEEVDTSMDMGSEKRRGMARLNPSHRRRTCRQEKGKGRGVEEGSRTGCRTK
jgi:hypothetical protein